MRPKLKSTMTVIHHWF